MDSLVKNAADAKQVKKAKKKEEYKREDEIEDLRKVLSDPCGRRTLWRYLSFCGVFKYGFEENDRYEAFMSGQRNVGGYIIGDLQDVDPGLFGQLSKEMQERKGTVND